ncbi:MAG: hypothetical protein ACOZAL_02725 [Patescibacteria group bacterium]
MGLPKFLEFEVDAPTLQEILTNLEFLGIDELKTFRAFLLKTKEKADDLIKCKGIAGAFLETVDGMILGMGIDQIVLLIDKIIVKLELK